nr:type II toxin-antitoxin system RelE/ParE family toxin [Phenylobacterium sp.]
MSEFSPLAAARLAARLASVADSLAEMPERGRPIAEGLRELTTVWPNLFRYRVTPELVEVVAIRHGARRPR